MLHDLVLSVERTAADDIRDVVCAGLFDSDGIYEEGDSDSWRRLEHASYRAHTFANICPPDILDRARTTAVNALSLSSSDDHILDCCTRFQDEDRVSFASLTLALAISRAAGPIEALHATVKCSLND